MLIDLFNICRNVFKWRAPGLVVLKFGHAYITCGASDGEREAPTRDNNGRRGLQKMGESRPKTCAAMIMWRVTLVLYLVHFM